MKTFLFLAITLLISANAIADEKIFYEVKSMDTMRLICPCEFNESIEGTAEGSYGSGRQVLIIAPNETQSYALINLGRDDIKLKPIGSFEYNCKPGEIFSPSWRSDNINITTKLKVLSPGEESCWFEGTLTLKQDKKTKTIRIKGACGCSRE